MSDSFMVLATKREARRSARSSVRLATTTCLGFRAAKCVAQSSIISPAPRSEEHTSELQSLMRISYAVFCLKKKKYDNNNRYSAQLLKVETKLYTIQNQVRTDTTYTDT